MTSLRKLFQGGLGPFDDWNIDMSREPRWLDARDHRSLRSAPALAARHLLSTWPYVLFLSLAKSGSEVNYPGPPTDDNVDVLEQLDKLQHMIGEHPIDVLLISVGMNDVRFSNIIEAYAKDDLSVADAALGFIQAQINLRGELQADEGYPAIAQFVEQSRLKVSDVLITEYPNYLFNDRGNRPAVGCGLFELGPGEPDDPLAPAIPSIEIDAEEADSMNVMGHSLNEEVEAAAERLGWRYVDGIDENFVGHGYCSGQSRFVFAEDSCEDQGNFKGLIHPNQNGTYLMSVEIEEHLRQVLDPPAGAQDPVREPDAGLAPEP